ncbi:unnamed protein product [Nippostrongylus brasiliensis]|uniref:AP2/ERF domain-containing protein n=1 Tax=Nippostrongylus brasiliensis TaxID=27835 RepID=A0A0N4Y9R5_NIPBR|nr:unnamed protein product [Nippostrongylus brasiliensis]
MWTESSSLTRIEASYRVRGEMGSWTTAEEAAEVWADALRIAGQAAARNQTPFRDGCAASSNLHSVLHERHCLHNIFRSTHCYSSSFHD